jgi:putative DNA primase/helicase
VKTAPAYSEEALALQFAELYEDELRYVAAWSRWVHWHGARWAYDDTLLAFDLARDVCRRAAYVQKRSVLASAKTVAAVVRLAMADRRLAATADQWDTDPWLLNTPTGTIDLRSGRLQRHSSTDYLTKITAVAPCGDCPRWRDFLERVTGGNANLQAFLKRFVGYGLTGIMREHSLVFAHGTGGNGKSTFINTVTAIMGDYATFAPIEAFTAATGDRHPTDLAMLRGARLVVAPEIEQGRRWAESRIKALTGGDPITARLMRQDFSTYPPQLKLFIIGNHRPSFRGVDEAIRRRFNIVPFTVTIPPEERDAELAEKLKAEWPGILNWMIEGCLEWQRVGLQLPDIVRDATDEYFAAEDGMGQWLSEACLFDRNGFSTTGELYLSWSQWCDATGEYKDTQKHFSQMLEARGLSKRRQGGTGKQGFTGILVRRDEQ